MKSNRPVNISLSTVLLVNRSPVAIASILHRISGVVIFLLIPVLLYLLQESLKSPDSFRILTENVLTGVVGGGLAFIALAGLIFHFVAGVKHILHDFGVGETLQGGRTNSTMAIILAVIGIVAALIWMVM